MVVSTIDAISFRERDAILPSSFLSFIFNPAEIDSPAKLKVFRWD
jgi:hypothetical protein